MGRSIPSFRMLIEIEKSQWKPLIRLLNKKEDKNEFNRLFSIPKLCCHSLSNLSKPLIIESIIMCILFYGYKMLSKINNHKLTMTTTTVTAALKYHDNDEDNGTYNQIMDHWKRFGDCLNEEDIYIFSNMISDCYKNYKWSIKSNIRYKPEFCFNHEIISLFMALILYRQNQINVLGCNKSFLD